MAESTKRVLITGAASGIGAATGELLRASGWEVIGTDRAGGGASIVAHDVTDEGAWKRVVADAWPVQALVNCAGVRTRAPIAELSREEFDRLQQILVTGTYLGIQAVSTRWIAEGIAGSVVNIASVVSTHAVAGQAHYVAAKAGVAGLTRAAAVELAPNGIRVNAIAPGVIRTPMTADRLGDPEQVAALEARVPLHRIGEPDDIANAIEFLISPKSSYITGVLLPVDGGWTAS